MNPEQWRRVEEVYHSALQQQQEHRDSFLARVCGDDEDLRREVASLLAQSGSTFTLAAQTAWESMAEQPEIRATLKTGERLGPYEILGQLGEGGMGTVYRGLDTRLGRPVAIKISAEQFSKRFEREARAISSLNHPHICTLYDIGSFSSGAAYLVTELVDGETFRDWLRHGHAAERNVEVARQVLEALRAAHNAGIVHRDLKPANIMLRRDGYVKVLDFGLAKQIQAPSALKAEDTATSGVSVPGQIVGTIAYMSPEQILGQDLDQRSDLFAFGIIFYEMLAGRHPWLGKSAVDTMHAILHDEPPPLETVHAGLVDKLLRKNREERYSSAEAVLEALSRPAPSPAPRPRAHTRLIVLPFRILRKHEASDFLSVSLPDAIASSLAVVDSLLVRSTMVASRFATSPEIDVKLIAEQAQVDAVLTGTILSDGEHLRVSTQLVQAPEGTLLWSTSSQVSLQDIFQLQDDLAERIVKALALPLTSREQRALKHDVPANAMAYELYLRANQLVAVGYNARNMILARDLYLRSVEADPKYAPAWACLGRTYRLIGKYGVEDLPTNLARAEDAFQKSLGLNPDLALAHNFYTSLETDMGHSLRAMERLLKRAGEHPNDPHLFAGLVHACRYCGQLKASVAAHELARRLDPNIRTTVVYTHLNRGDFQAVLDQRGPGDDFAELQALIALGRKPEAMAYFLEFEKTNPRAQLLLYAASRRAFIEGDGTKSLDALNTLLELDGPLTRDPESHFWMARDLASLDQPDRALSLLSLALESGYRCHYALLHDHCFDSVRLHRGFTELLARAEALDLEARTVFLENGGQDLLGVRAG